MTSKGDDFLPRNDGRQPKETPSRSKTDRFALSSMRPDHFSFFEDSVVKIGEIVYFPSRYKVIM